MQFARGQRARAYILSRMSIFFEHVAAVDVGHIFYESLLLALEFRKAIVVRTTDTPACAVKVRY